MKKLSNILPYIKHDMRKTNIDKISVLFFDNVEYKPLFKEAKASLEDIVRCRRSCEVVSYDTKQHILFVQPVRYCVYDYFIECQIEFLLDCGFIGMDIIWDDYSSKKAMNDAILTRLRRKHPEKKEMSLKDFAQLYGVEWFSEV